MIAFEPNFKQVCELPVLREVLRRKVAMVVENGLGRCILVVEAACRRSLQKEIVVDECRHDVASMCESERVAREIKYTFADGIEKKSTRRLASAGVPLFSAPFPLFRHL